MQVSYTSLNDDSDELAGEAYVHATAKYSWLAVACCAQ